MDKIILKNGCYKLYTDINGNVMANLIGNRTYNVVGSKDGWYQINVNGRIGYVSPESVTHQTKNTTIPTNPVNKVIETIKVDTESEEKQDDVIDANNPVIALKAGTHSLHSFPTMSSVCIDWCC